MEARGVTLRLRTARANPLRRDTDESLALKTRRFRADASSNCSCFRQLRVPWHGVEPLLFDRATVHQARAERAVVHPDQRVRAPVSARAAVKGQRPSPTLRGHQAIRSTHDNFSQTCPVHSSSASSITCRSGSMRSCRMRETRMPPGSGRKTRRACLVPCGASRRERGRRGVQTPGCPPASGNRLQARQCSGRSAGAPSAQRILADAQYVGLGIA
jgi:hypothetical protein